MTNDTVINRFLNHHRKSGKSILTLSAYATDLKQFSALSPSVFSALSSDQVAAICQRWTLGLSSNSAARKLTSLRELLKWAHQLGYIKANLSATIHIPRRQSVAPVKQLSPTQISRLRRAANTRERLLLELLLQTGLKLNEVIGLRVSQIDLKSAFILKIPIALPLRQALEYYLSEIPRGPKSTLLTSPTGRPLTGRVASLILSALARKAGVRGVTPRNLRTTFIIRQLEAGTPMSVVQQVVGHQHLATTHRYLTKVKSPPKPPPLNLATI